jgi:RNA polymerase sigma-70 factor, ECF subfamily
MNKISDRKLAKMVQNGDDDAFNILLKRYRSKIKRYGQKFLSNNMDIEDIVQDIFLKAYQNINSFDTKRKFSPWIYRIAHNEYINFLKKRDREPIRFFDPEVIFPFYPSRIESDQLAKDDELKDKLDSSLRKIKSKYREVLILYYYEDMSYQEISDILKIPVSTVGVRLKRARDKIRKEYEKKGK